MASAPCRAHLLPAGTVDDRYYNSWRFIEGFCLVVTGAEDTWYYESRYLPFVSPKFCLSVNAIHASGSYYDEEGFFSAYPDNAIDEFYENFLGDFSREIDGTNKVESYSFKRSDLATYGGVLSGGFPYSFSNPKALLGEYSFSMMTAGSGRTLLSEIDGLNLEKMSFENSTLSELSVGLGG